MSSGSNVTWFPAPVGGVALPQDLAPSIIFAVMYGLLIPITVYRFLNKSSRGTLVLQTGLFIVERVVIFSFRAVQSRNQAKRESKSLATYMQITIAMGFIGIAQDLVNIMRCLLVNSTKGSSPKESPRPIASTDPEARLDTMGPDSEIMDLPRERSTYRAFSGVLSLSFIAAIVPGVIGNARYGAGIDNQVKADKTFRLRYLSTGLALVCTLVLVFTAFWARFKIPRTQKRAATLMTFLTLLLIIPPIYRLSVMCNRTTSLVSTAPGSQNTAASKATFYIFHMLPEWIASAALVGVNIRQVFNTGPFGDYMWRDMTPGEIEKRRKRGTKRATMTDERKAKNLEDKMKKSVENPSI